MQKFLLGAYWKARQDSVDKCAEDAEAFFTGLQTIDPLFADWYERAMSPKAATQTRLDTTAIEPLKMRLLGGRNRRDVGDTVIEDLGFNLGVWNGADLEEAQASLSLHCGCYNARINNNVLIHLPYRTNSAWVDNADALLALVARIWRPDWAGIMSRKAIRERKFDSSRPFVDWMVYVPRKIQSVPVPGHVRPLEGLGSIITVYSAPPTSGDEHDESQIREIEALLAA